MVNGGHGEFGRDNLMDGTTLPGGHLARQATIADGEHVFRPDRLWSARLKKDTQMTDSSGDGLLDHAKRLCSALETFSNAYMAYERGDGSGGFRDVQSTREGINAIQSAWETAFPICIETGKLAVGKSGTIADWIRDAGKWCKWFTETIQKQGFSETVFAHSCDGVHRVVRESLASFGIEPKS